MNADKTAEKKNNDVGRLTMSFVPIYQKLGTWSVSVADCRRKST